MKVPIPREHGTWAMLYAPILCALFTEGHPDLRFLLFLLSTTAAFFARDPFEAFVRARKTGSQDQSRLAGLRNWALIYSVVAVATAALLIGFFRLYYLVAFGALFAVMLIAHSYWISRRVDRRIGSELTAVAALTSSAAACRYVLTGSLDLTAFGLWGLNFLFFASSVFYLKMRVSRHARKKDATRYTSICLAYHFFLVAALAILVQMEVLSWLGCMAFLAILARTLAGIIVPGKRLSLMRIGLAEVAYTVAFVFFLTADLRF